MKRPTLGHSLVLISLVWSIPLIEFGCEIVEEVEK